MEESKLTVDDCITTVIRFSTTDNKEFSTYGEAYMHQSRLLMKKKERDKIVKEILERAKKLNW